MRNSDRFVSLFRFTGWGIPYAAQGKVRPVFLVVFLLFCAIAGLMGYGAYKYCMNLEYIERSEFPVAGDNRLEMLKGYSIREDSIKDAYYAHRIGLQMLDSYLRLDTMEGMTDMVVQTLAGFFIKEGVGAGMTRKEPGAAHAARVIEELSPLPWWSPDSIKNGYCLETEGASLQIWADLDHHRVYVYRGQ